MKRKVIYAVLIGIGITLCGCGEGQDKAENAESVQESTLPQEAVGSEDNSESTSDSSSEKQGKSSKSKSKEKTSLGENTKSSEAEGLTDQSTLNDGEELSGETFTATESDVSAVEVSGGVNASINSSTIAKSSGDATSADDSSFKGVNAAVRVYGDSTLTITDCVISANAENATGVFAYDTGTIYISDSTVDVTGGGSGGIQVAGGGTLYADNLTVTSASKAAIRSDRGGGTLIVDGGTYTSTGTGGCPAIYSTADITVSNADCVSENSRAVIIEGKNSVTLNNCNLSGNDQSTKEGSIKANVLLYQSASGDADEGTSEFKMNGGSMTCSSGAMFYCTNTSSVIDLDNAELTLSDDESLLIVSAGRWGKDGKNGGNCILNAKNQILSGSIKVDDISNLELNLTDSSYEGAINTDGQAGDISVELGNNSTWELTGDSYISSFEGSTDQIITNGYHVYVSGNMLI